MGGYLIRKTKVLLLGGWQDSALTILKHFKNNSQYQFYVGDRWEYSVSRFSRYCNGFILLPDFAEDEKAYLKELIKSYKDNKIDVLLPIPQDEMVLVSRNKDRLLKEGLRFLVPDYDLLEIAIDKYKLGEHLLKHSIPYPQTYCLANYTGQEILEKEGLPLITKLRRGTGQHDQRISYDEAGFFRHLEMVISKYGREEIIVQKFIQGLEIEAMYTVGLLCDQNSELVTVVPTKKIRSRPYSGGSGVCVKTVVDASITEICEKAICSFGKWVGIMDIEVKIDPHNGKVYLIEINPRPWGVPMFAVLLSGVNIIDLWIKAVEGEKIQRKKEYTEGVYSVDIVNDYLLFMDLLKDIFTAHRKSALKNLKSYIFPYFSNHHSFSLSSCIDFDYLDPLPFLFKLFRLRRNLLYSLLPTSKGRRDRV